MYELTSDQFDAEKAPLEQHRRSTNKNDVLPAKIATAFDKAGFHTDWQKQPIAPGRAVTVQFKDAWQTTAHIGLDGADCSRVKRREHDGIAYQG